MNGSLRLITQGVYEEIECYQKNNQQRFPEPKELKAMLDLRFSRIVDARKQNFFEFIEWFSMVYAPKKQLIKNNETSATSPNTLKTYVTTLRLLKIFAKANGSFDFKDINLEWYQSFTDWCNSKKNYNPSTIGKHIKVIKTWLRKAEDDGLHCATFYKHQDFRKPSYLSETIYLNRDELALIQKLDLSNHVELDRIRDLFLVGAWTGLRFSDFNRFAKSRYWKYFCSKSAEYSALVPVAGQDTTIQYILNGKVLDNNFGGNLALIDDKVFKEIKVLSKEELQKQYGIQNKDAGVLINSEAPKDLYNGKKKF